jgi:hypothetical protein
MSVENYLLIESGQAQVDPDYSYVYVSGVLDALSAFNEAMRSAGVSLFCPVDEQQVIEIEVFKGLIDQAITRARTEQADFAQYARAASIGIIGLRVLNEALPCSTASESEPIMPAEPAD